MRNIREEVKGREGIQESYLKLYAHCGLSVPLSKFWETIYNDIDDIEVVSFSGLGRRRGFERTEAYSVLDDEETREAVASRCHAILELLGKTFEDEAE